MKRVIIAVLLMTPLFAQAATPLPSNYEGELKRVSSISVQGGTHSELANKLKVKAAIAGADFYRITHINTKNKGFASATLYSKADM